MYIYCVYLLLCFVIYNRVAHLTWSTSAQYLVFSCLMIYITIGRVCIPGQISSLHKKQKKQAGLLSTVTENLRGNNSYRRDRRIYSGCSKSQHIVVSRGSAFLPELFKLFGD